MFTTRGGHWWHMVVMVGIVVGAAIWFGVSTGGMLLLASLACVATIAALVWLALWSARARSAERTAQDPVPPPDSSTT